MTLLTETGTFTKRSGTGSQTVTLANSSLTPKVLWLWASLNTTANAYAEHHSISFGFSDGTTDACQSKSGVDNAATALDGTHQRDDAVLFLYDGTGGFGTAAQADVTSFNAGNFILNWSVSNASAYIIHYLVVGGTDITNVKVITRQVSDGTGASSYTDIGFQGDFIMFLNSGQSYTLASTQPTSIITIGAAVSSSARWMIGGAGQNTPTTMNTYNWKEMSAVMGQYQANGGTGALMGLADFTGFTSTGFNLNYTTTFANTADPFATLVIKGGLWDVGNGTAPASTGNQTVNITSGRDPEAVMMMTWGDTTTSSGAVAEDQDRLSIGAADNSLNENCISIHDTDNVPTSIITQISLNTKIIRAHTAAATASSSTTLAEADIVNMSNVGNFVIGWTTTLSGMGYVWFAVSKPSGTSLTRTVTTEAVTVSESAPTRLLSATRVPSTDNVVVAESSLTRAVSAARTISTDNVAIGESITAVVTRARTPSVDNTAVTESAPTRLLSATRVPSTDNVVVGESLTRGQSLSRTPSSDNVAISEPALTRQLSSTRVPSTENVPITESSPTRQLSAIRVPSADNVVIGESAITRMRSLPRAPSSDNVSITESAPIRQQSLTRVPGTENTAVGESLSRMLSAARSVSSTDNVVIGESVSGGKVTSRIVSIENVPITETSLTSSITRVRAPSIDNVAITENLSRLLQLFRTINESVTVADVLVTAARSLSRAPSVTDNVPIADASLTRQLSITRVLNTDSVPITDSSLTRSLTRVRAPSIDVVAVADASLNRMASLTRIITIEAVSISESITTGTATSQSRSVSDTVVIGESLSRMLQLSRSPAVDNVAITENVTRALSLLRIINDSNTTINESLDRSTTNTRIPTVDNVSISDASLIRLLSLSRSLSESVDIADATLERALTLSRTPVADSISILEDLIGEKIGPVIFRSPVVDNVPISEFITAVLTLMPAWVVGGRTPQGDWHDTSPEQLLSNLLHDNWDLQLTDSDLSLDRVRWDQLYDANADLFLKVQKGSDKPVPSALGWTHYLEEYELEVLITARSLVDTYDPAAPKSAEYYLDMIENYVRKAVSLNPSALEAAGLFNIRYTDTYASLYPPRTIRASNVTDVRSRIVRIVGDVLHGLINRAP